MKEGRGRGRDGKPDPHDNDELHVLITADNDDALEKVGCGGGGLGHG